MSALSKLIDTVRSEGPIDFARFMDIALYDRAVGYYSATSPGAEGDFYTSPSLTPAFGILIGRLLNAMFSVVGESFTVLEIGGGGGQLAKSAASTRPDIRWTFVEKMARLEDLQRSLLGTGANFSWLRDFPVTPIQGCAVLNEVLDNLPFRLFELGNPDLLEVRIGLEGDSLTEVLVPVDIEPPPASRFLEKGDRFEVRDRLPEFIRSCSKSITSGFIVIIDYGDHQPEIWTRRPAGSLVTYNKGRLGLNPLESPGECDITSHVDFTALEEELSLAGWQHITTMPQSDALRALGIDGEISFLKTEIRARQEAEKFDELVSELAELSRITSLVHPGIFGEFKFLLASKNAPSPGELLSAL